MFFKKFGLPPFAFMIEPSGRFAQVMREHVRVNHLPKSRRAASYSAGELRLRKDWKLGSTSDNSAAVTIRVGTRSNRNTGRSRFASSSESIDATTSAR